MLPPSNGVSLLALASDSIRIHALNVNPALQGSQLCIMNIAFGTDPIAENRTGQVTAA